MKQYYLSYAKSDVHAMNKIKKIEEAIEEWELGRTRERMKPSAL